MKKQILVRKDEIVALVVLGGTVQVRVLADCIVDAERQEDGSWRYAIGEDLYYCCAADILEGGLK